MKIKNYIHELTIVFCSRNAKTANATLGVQVKMFTRKTKVTLGEMNPDVASR